MVAFRKLGAPLSKAEEEVLAYLISGYTDQEISEIFGVSRNSIKQKRGSIMKKYGVHKLIELANVEMFCPNCGTCLRRKDNETT